MSQASTPRQEPDANRTEPDRSAATQVATEDFEAFREELRYALLHLHDPHYRPPPVLAKAMDCDPAGGPGPVQSRIIASIAGLEPDPTVPGDSRARRDFDSLHKRFVLGLTQEMTAGQLHMSVRNVQRVQAEATHGLARILWAGSLVSAAPDSIPAIETGPRPQESRAVVSQAPDWRTQTRHELASLQSSAPDAVSVVKEAISGVLELEEVLTQRESVYVELGHVQPDLVAALHPSVLRQILITALGRLARYASAGPIAIYAVLEDGKVKITLTSTLAADRRPSQADLIGDIMVPDGGAVEVAIDGQYVFLSVKVPSGGEIIVLAVDDNPDMVHFYRRATAGTRYRIVHATGGQHIAEAIEATVPNIIVLDIMLPDVDGWQLLMQLHEDTSTRSIPIVVCSVVREKDLALALGAALYLSKPIEPRRFAEALDQVLHRDSTEAPTVRANSAATC